MTQRITCRTQFDITATGVRNNFHRNRVPFDTAQGIRIDTDQAWNRARNQQRNWETLNQLISLRTQPFDIVPNGHDAGTWQFEFEVEHGEVYSTTGYAGDLTGLVNECAGVPMLTGLTEKLTDQAVLVTAGPDQNIWFEPINK